MSRICKAGRQCAPGPGRGWGRAWEQRWVWLRQAAPRSAEHMPLPPVLAGSQWLTMLEWTVACSMYLAMPVTNAFLSSKFVSKFAYRNERTETFVGKRVQGDWVSKNESKPLPTNATHLCGNLSPHRPLIFPQENPTLTHTGQALARQGLHMLPQVARRALEVNA